MSEKQTLQEIYEQEVTEDDVTNEMKETIRKFKELYGDDWASKLNEVGSKPL
jgi:hypothetical protein